MASVGHHFGKDELDQLFQRHHSPPECDLVSRLPLPRPPASSWLMVLRLQLLTKAASTRDITRLIAPLDIEPDTSRYR